MDRHDTDLILLLATSSASLATTKKKDNWIEYVGGELPPYVRKIARAVRKSGKSLSSAIAIAISRIKKWAAGGDGVDADTQAKSVKTLAEWEALKAKNKAKQLVKATRADGSSYLLLSNIGSFNTDLVRSAWAAESRRRNRDRLEDFGSVDRYIYELWTDHVIIEVVGGGYERVPYTVTGADVTFGDPTPVRREWVADPDADTLTPAERALLADILDKKDNPDFLARVREIAQRG